MQPQVLGHVVVAFQNNLFEGGGIVDGFLCDVIFEAEAGDSCFVESIVIPDRAEDTDIAKSHIWFM